MNYLEEASRILFDDPEFASQEFMSGQLDDLFSHPFDSREVSINGLIAELMESATPPATQVAA